METNDEERNGCIHAIIVYAMGLAILVVCILFSSCRTAKCLPETEYVHDSIVNTQFLHDSIFEFIHDSTFIKEKGDTIFIDRTHTRTKYVERLAHDTIVQTKEKEVVQTKITNELTSGQKGMIRGFWILLVMLIVSIAVYVFSKTKYGKTAWAFIKAFFIK